MIGYTIVTISEEITSFVHTTLTDPIYHHPVQVNIAGEGDYGPCRLCLNTFSIGERRILFLYNPFSAESDFAGPIYMHAEQCQPYPKIQMFPEALRSLPITLRGYDTQHNFVAEERPHNLNVEAGIEKLLRRPEVEFIHVRNSVAKCFILRIERASPLL